MLKNLRNVMFSAGMLVCSMVAPAYAGMFTVTDIVVYDSIFAVTTTYADCKLNPMSEVWSLQGTAPTIDAECENVTAVPGDTNYPNPAGTMHYISLHLNQDDYIRPLHWCRKLNDVTTYVPPVGNPPENRPYQYRLIKFRCTGGAG